MKSLNLHVLGFEGPSMLGMTSVMKAFDLLGEEQFSAIPCFFITVYFMHRE